MKTILLTGASGLIGKALVKSLRARGDRVLSLVRKPSSSSDELQWDPMALTLDASKLLGHAEITSGPPTAIVHLAGEPVGASRWNDEIKRSIIDSRVRSTTLLAELAAKLEIGALVSASGVGFYGLHADAVTDESGPKGGGFLADVVDRWEAAQSPARAAGVRCVSMRLGVVVDADGGALAKMLPVFKLGVGGPIGDGEQWFSHLSLEDVVRAFEFAIDTPSLEGPVNVANPNPVTNADFTKALASRLHRPAFMRVPAIAIGVAFGEMGRETVLASQRVRPAKLTEAGFTFLHPTIDDVLAAALP